MSVDTRPNVLRFGTFELDVRSRKLRDGSRRVRLQEQPFRDSPFHARAPRRRRRRATN